MENILIYILIGLGSFAVSGVIVTLIFYFGILKLLKG
jgi:hypothetical protein